MRGAAGVCTSSECAAVLTACSIPTVLYAHISRHHAYQEPRTAQPTYVHLDDDCSLPVVNKVCVCVCVCLSRCHLLQALAGRHYNEQLHGLLTAAGSTSSLVEGAPRTLVIHEVRPHAADAATAAAAAAHLMIDHSIDVPVCCKSVNSDGVAPCRAEP
jgi:hypothetical protein